MFSIGEKIVYPVHGAGVVESIENREILGEVRSYYVLRITSGDLQVLVPVDTAEKVGMRLVSDAERLRQAREFVSQEMVVDALQATVKKHRDRKARLKALLALRKRVGLLYLLFALKELKQKLAG